MKKKCEKIFESKSKKIEEKFTNKHKRGIAALIAAFGVVAFWRGSWMLMDIFLFPNNQVLSALISLIGGIVIILILNYNFDDLF